MANLLPPPNFHCKTKFMCHLVNFVKTINVFQTTRLVNEAHKHPSVKHATQHELNLKFPRLLDLKSHLVNFVTTINVLQTTKLGVRKWSS